MTKLEAYRAALTEACRVGDVAVVKVLTKAIFSETDDVNDIILFPNRNRRLSKTRGQIASREAPR